MDLKDYQEQSRKTAIYPDKDNNIVYPTLGLVGEAGEVAEKIKKVLRDHNGQITNEKREEIKKELGDVLWYLSQISTELELELADVAHFNIEKLTSRKNRGKLQGDGDNR